MQKNNIGTQSYSTYNNLN